MVCNGLEMVWNGLEWIGNGLAMVWQWIGMVWKWIGNGLEMVWNGLEWFTSLRLGIARRPRADYGRSALTTPGDPLPVFFSTGVRLTQCHLVYPDPTM
eukprot:8926430-Pyramimonas_sp.AAC.1